MIGSARARLMRGSTSGLLKVGPTAPAPTRTRLLAPAATSPGDRADLVLGSSFRFFLGPDRSTARPPGGQSSPGVEAAAARLVEAAWGFNVWSTITWRAPRASTASSAAKTPRLSALRVRRAGPVHAWLWASRRVPRVLVPFGRAPSRVRPLAAPLAFDFVRTAPHRLDAADWAASPRFSRRWRSKGDRLRFGPADGDTPSPKRRDALLARTEV